jgi:hypothetical protein
MTMVIAQALVEYGALSWLAAGIVALRYTVEDWLGSADPRTAVIAGGLVLVWLIFHNRRSPRL